VYQHLGGQIDPACKLDGAGGGVCGMTINAAMPRPAGRAEARPLARDLPAEAHNQSRAAALDSGQGGDDGL